MARILFYKKTNKNSKLMSTFVSFIIPFWGNGEQTKNKNIEYT